MIAKRLSWLISLAFLLLPLGLRAEDIVLQNDHCKIVFGGEDNYLLKSFEMEGVDIAAPQTTHLWEVELLGPRGENVVVKPWDVTFDKVYKKFETVHFS